MMGAGLKPPARSTPPRDYVARQLRETQSKIKLYDVATGLVIILVGVVGYITSLIILDQLFVLSTAVRMTLLAAFVLGTIGFLTWAVIQPAMQRVNDLFAAKAVEAADPSIKNSLINWLLLSKKSDEIPPHFLRAIEGQAATDLAKVDLDDTVDHRTLMRALYLLGGLVTVFCVYSFLTTKELKPSLQRVLLPLADIQPPTHTTLTDIRPGTVKAPAGEKVDISCFVSGKPTNEVVAYLRTEAGGYWEPIPLEAPAEKFGMWKTTLFDRQRSFDYYLAANDYKSTTFRVEIVPAPMITDYQITYQYPEYTKLPTRTSSDGNIDALEGTTVTIEATTNVPVRIETKEGKQVGGKLLLTFSRSAENRPLLVPAGANDRLQATLDLRESGSYQIDFADLLGQLPQTRPVKTIHVQADLAPKAQFIEPELESIDRPVNSSVAFRLLASDDFGLDSVRIRIIRSQDTQQLLSTEMREATGANAAGARVFLAQVDLEKIGANVGDLLEYHAEVQDNRRPTPNIVTTQAQPRRIRIIEPKKLDPDQKPMNDPNNQNPMPNQQPQNNQNPDQKPNEPRPGDPKQGEPKPNESKPGDGKQGESKPSESKTGDSKQNESKQGESKSGDSKSGDPKQGESKSGDSKTGEGKPGEQKPGENQTGESKSGDSKTGEKKDGDRDQSGLSKDDQNKLDELKKLLAQNDPQKQDRAEKQPGNEKPKEMPKDQPKQDPSEKGAGERKPGQEKSATNKQDPNDPMTGETKPGEENTTKKPGGEQTGDKKYEAKDQPAADGAPKKKEEGQAEEKSAPGNKSVPTKRDAEKSDGSVTKGEQKNESAGKAPSDKNDSSQPKSGEPKAGDSKTGEAKQGEPKSGEPKPGDPKSGEPKAGEPKPGSAEKKPTDGASKPGEPKAAEKKADGATQPGKAEQKQDQPQQGDSKDGQPKPEGDPNNPQTKPDGKQEQKNDAAASKAANKQGNSTQGESPKPGNSATGSPSEKKADNPNSGGDKKGEGPDQKPGESKKADGAQSKPGEEKGDKPGAGKGQEKGDKPGAGGDGKEKADQPGEGSGGAGEKKQSNAQPKADAPGDKPNDQPKPKEETQQKPPGESKPNDLSKAEGKGDPTTGSGNNSPMDTPIVDNTGDAPDPADRQKQTELVLKKLEDQLKEKKVDPELLKKMGMTEEELRQFTQRVKEQYQAKPKEEKIDDPLKGKERDGYRLNKSASSGARATKQDEQRDLFGGRKVAPPPELQKQFDAYTKSLGQSEPEKK